MTYDLAMAAGWDAATARMRRDNRDHFNEEDYNELVATFNRLWPKELPVVNE